MHVRSRSRAQEATFSLLVAVWFGLLSGLIEVAILTLKKSYFSPIMKLSWDFVWMAPLAEMIFFLIAGLFIFCLSQIWKRVDQLHLTILVCALLGLLNILLLVPGLNHYAAVLLATGVAVQAARSISRRSDPFCSLVRRSVVWMIGLVVIVGLGVRGWDLIGERTALASLPTGTENAPNVLLITLDTVRAANMSLYEYSRPTTPHLEQLAKTGVVFERALSTSSWTLPSHASMFTGRWPHELSADLKVPLDASFPTLAEVLSARGYFTAGFVANLGYSSYETGIDRGFVHYEDYEVSLGQIASSSTFVRTIANNFRLRRLIQNDEHLNRKRADQVNHDVFHWLSQARNRPFFVFVNYFDAHEPYLPPPPFDRNFGPGRNRGKHSPLHHWLWNPAVNHQNMNEGNVQEEVDAYDGAIAYLDHQLGVLFAKLKQWGLLENTLIIITADHGEEFGEHGLYDHGYSLYLPSLHVPLLISFPGHVPQGKRVQTPVSLRDLPATIIDLLHFEGESPFPGKSLARHWEPRLEEDNLHNESLLSETNYMPGHPAWFPTSKGNMKSILYEGMHYIRNGDGREELYKFRKDPWERDNLALSDENGKTLDKYRGILDRMVVR